MPGCELTGTPAVFNADSSKSASVAPAESNGTGDFSLPYTRLLEAAGVCTMQALAELFRVRMSCVSDVKRRGKIPATWLYHLMLTRRVSPQWILFGTGPKELGFADMGTESVTSLLLRTATE